MSTSTSRSYSEAPLLERVRARADLRALSTDQLRQIADELRAELIAASSAAGGQSEAGLGIVELAVALHRVFDAQHDKLIWDLGHEIHPYNVLIGQRHLIPTPRPGSGRSGFIGNSEGEYGPFRATHRSTSISASLGIAMARDLKGEDFRVVAVVSYGAMGAGMIYEAVNNAGALKRRLVVILNDSDMAVAPPVGAMSAYLSRLVSSRSCCSPQYQRPDIAATAPRPVVHGTKRAEEYARGTAAVDTLFEELGFSYVGPVDGRNLDQLLPALENAAKADAGPVLVHVVARKGEGHGRTKAASDKYHGATRFNVVTGMQEQGLPEPSACRNVFADALSAEAEHDAGIVAIIAAMPSGIGIDRFAKRFPGRTFSVGNAEQHAVTFAAGMACEGFKPFCAIYSSSLQRAYDQVVHDVAIQSLPVRFAIDRAGVLGFGGATHAGSFDLGYLGCLPGMVLMAPSDEVELVHMVATAAAIDDRPCALWCPRDGDVEADLPKRDGKLRGEILPLGRGRILREGNSVALLSLGTRLADTLRAADALTANGFSATVADARFAKPLDTVLIERLVREHEALITIEEGVAGGFGAAVMQHLAWRGLLDGKLKLRSMTLPDRFIDQDSSSNQSPAARPSTDDIVSMVRATIGGSARRGEEVTATQDRPEPCVS